jgi:hypothetical protein
MHNFGQTNGRIRQQGQGQVCSGSITKPQSAAETAIARNRSLLAEAQRVGDSEHLKVFADAGAAETWFGENMRHPFQGRASSASNRRAAFEYEGSGVNPHSKRKRQNEKPGNRPGAR